MGMYEEVVKELPPLPPELREGGAKYQWKVDQEKEKIPIEMRTPAALAEYYATLKTEKKNFDEKKYELNLKLEAVAQMLALVYEGEGISSQTLRGVGAVRTQSEPYAHVADKEEYRQWCVENGFEQQMTLPWTTTNKTLKDLLLEGGTPPPGIEAYFRTTVVFTPEK